jgi:hypothetical protein
MSWNDLRTCALNKLIPIHKSLPNFYPPNQIIHELPEQIMACLLLNENDSVLEFGGSIGRNSCVINSILKDKTKHVVIEPNPTEYAGLEKNRVLCGLEYKTESAAISKVPLYAKHWATYSEQVEDSILVNTMTYDDFKLKYDISFNTIIIDNEGNFPQTLRDYPSILDGIRLIIIEHDFKCLEDLQYFCEVMESNKFTLTVQYLKNYPHAPGMNWPYGVIGDPVFVSAWTRDV